MFLLSCPLLRPRAVPWDLEIVIAIPLFWLLWAVMARGGLSPTLAGISLVRRDGRPASRLACGWRTFLVWAPLAALLVGSRYIQESSPESTVLCWGLWLGGLVLLAGYVVTALILSAPRPPRPAGGDGDGAVMRSDSTTRPHPPRSSLRWRSVALWAGLLAGIAVIVAGLYAIDPWLPLMPRDLGRLWTERFLRALLIVYPSLLVLTPLSLVASAGILLRYRRQGRRAPRLSRLCLACGSAALSILAMELAAAAWLAWEHRLPVLPTTFADQAGSGDELSLVVIGGSSALGYPYNPTLSIGQIVAWQIEQALPGKKVVLDIRANLGKNTEEMHIGLVDLNRRPDILIIYSAHNEFLSRFEDSRDAGYSEVPDGAILRGRLSSSASILRSASGSTRRSASTGWEGRRR